MSRAGLLALLFLGLLLLAGAAGTTAWWQTDCDRPLWTRCPFGCPDYDAISESHLGAPESRCALPDGQVLRVVLVDEGIFVPHFFDEDGTLIAVREEQQDDGPAEFCDGRYRERYDGPRLDCR